MIQNKKLHARRDRNRKRFILFDPIGLLIIALLLLFGLMACENKEKLYPELWGAASAGDLEEVKQLVGKGLDVNKKDLSGGTPIFHAATGGHTDVVKYLISKGADINVRENSMNLSPLSAAASGGYADTVLVLLNAGATDTANAYIYAEKYHRRDIMEMLKNSAR